MTTLFSEIFAQLWPQPDGTATRRRAVRPQSVGRRSAAPEQPCAFGFSGDGSNLPTIGTQAAPSLSPRRPPGSPRHCHKSACRFEEEGKSAGFLGSRHRPHVRSKGRFNLGSADRDEARRKIRARCSPIRSTAISTPSRRAADRIQPTGYTSSFRSTEHLENGCGRACRRHDQGGPIASAATKGRLGGNEPKGSTRCGLPLAVARRLPRKPCARPEWRRGRAA
jgi:hypothetical protein